MREAAAGPDGRLRCPWSLGSAEYLSYHDAEWGRPVRDDIGVFERICLEGFQSGLSWLIILRKRENFRAAFAGFDPVTVAEFGPADVTRLLADTGIVRNRAKIEATINNARAALGLPAGLAATVWSYAPSQDGAAGEDVAPQTPSRSIDLPPPPENSVVKGCSPPNRELSPPPLVSGWTWPVWTGSDPALEQARSRSRSSPERPGTRLLPPGWFLAWRRDAKPARTAGSSTGSCSGWPATRSAASSSMTETSGCASSTAPSAVSSTGDRG